jgi:hypothetical protein
MDKIIYYYLDLTAINCIVKAKVNGLPAYDLIAKSGTYFAKPINELLIGKKNKLEIELIPILDEKDIENGTIPEYSAKGSIKLYQEGQVSSPEEGEIILKIEQINKLKTLLFFNNDKFNFEEILINTTPILDEKAIKDYAIKLLEMLQNSDSIGLYNEFEPKFTDHEIAYYKNSIQLVEDFKKHMQNNFYPNLIQPPIQKEQLLLIAHCDKRIWQILVAPNKPLFQTEENEEGDIYSMEIYVGFINNQLKIVR